MKFSITRYSKLIAPCAAAVALMIASHTAEASITINFSQQGNNVVARTSGSLATGTLGINITGDRLDDGLAGAPSGLLAFDDNSLVNTVSGSGTIIDSGLSVNPNSFSGDAFGFTQFNGQSFLIIDTDAVSGELDEDLGRFVSLLEPRTVWTFENQTLLTLGLGDLVGNNNSRIVYTDTLTGDTIVFVPEPSSMLMLALGAVGFTFRRRR